MSSTENERTERVATVTLGESMAVAIAFFYAHSEVTTAGYPSLISELIAMPIKNLGTDVKRRTVLIIPVFDPPLPCSWPVQMELRQNVDLAGQPSSPWEVVRVAGRKRLDNGGTIQHVWTKS